MQPNLLHFVTTQHTHQSVSKVILRFASSYLEKAETGVVGHALALCGYGT
jgi:hypothetical protein